MQDFIKINKDDNVAVALKPIAKGTTVNVAGTDVTTLEDVPQGHKFAIKPIKKGDAVIKYGFRIGYAQADVEVGGWIHTTSGQLLGSFLIILIIRKAIKMLNLQMRLTLRAT